MTKLSEGQYDDTVAAVRKLTNGRHVLTLILDGDHGSGFAIHVAGVTKELRIQNTKRMLVAVAQIAQAIINGIAVIEGSTPQQTQQRIEQDRNVVPFEVEPSRPRCPHCGANLPQVLA